MAKPIRISIDLRVLLDAYRQGHPAFKKSPKNDKWYVDCEVWLNDTQDRFGNDVSVNLKMPKDTPRDTKKTYIANGKRNGNGGGSMAQAGASAHPSAPGGVENRPAPPGWASADSDGLPF